MKKILYKDLSFSHIPENTKHLDAVNFSNYAIIVESLEEYKELLKLRIKDEDIIKNAEILAKEHLREHGVGYMKSPEAVVQNFIREAFAESHAKVKEEYQKIVKNSQETQSNDFFAVWVKADKLSADNTERFEALTQDEALAYSIMSYLEPKFMYTNVFKAEKKPPEMGK